MKDSLFLEKRAELLEKIQPKMSAKRFRHVLGVEESGILLAQKYGGDVHKASIAALCHDYAKERSDEEFQEAILQGNFDKNLLKWNNAIWHGIVGAKFVREELGIVDKEILEAIQLHTTGAAEMSLLAKILYVADYIEPNRNFPGVAEARKIANLDLDEAVAFETKQTLAYLVENNQPIYPKTIETYNRWVAKKEGV